AVPQTACPLTLNHSVLLRVVDGLEPRVSAIDAGTNIGDALAEAVIRLDHGAGGRPKGLILLSDGAHTLSKTGAADPRKPRQAAQLAANLGIKVYTIDAGGDPTPGEEGDQRRAGRAALQSVATMTDGRSFAAASGTDLMAAYREIDELEKEKVVSFQY